MSRLKKSKKISSKIGLYFKRNPEVVKALKVFDISFGQYRKAVEGETYVYTSTTTSLPLDSLQKG